MTTASTIPTVMLPQCTKEICAMFQRNAGDTGSPEVQIALLTSRIQRISEHNKTHKKDLHCKVGLLKHVNTRRSLLAYLKRTDAEGYVRITKALGLRR